MVGSMKGFKTLAKNVNPRIVTTHCFLHREVLVTKTLGPELQLVMDQVVKMVNFIKSRPCAPKFLLNCAKIWMQIIALLLHTEVR